MSTKLSRPLAWAAAVLVCAGSLDAGTGDPPTVTVLYPNGGEILTSGRAVTIRWHAEDDSGYIAAIDVFLSFDGGVHWDPLAQDLFDEGQYTWFVHNRPGPTFVRVRAHDAFSNFTDDQNDTAFTIVSAPGGRVPSTLRDFDLPGTQPLGVLPLNPPEECSGCHGFYDTNVEPYFNWKGSMMAYASVDPLFLAAFEVAKNDAPESTDLCLRCHIPAAWLAGRSNPTDGSQVDASDRHGVSCDVCHRMLDPQYVAGVSPAEDFDILAALREIPVDPGDGQYVIDPLNFRRRGPLTDADLAPHDWLYSPFHQESALCGTCHEVSNPAFSRQPDGSFMPNPFDTPPPSMSPHEIGGEQRTYSEWFFSAFNSPTGVYAPEFGGERDYVSSCQHCHMPATTGQMCGFSEAPVRVGAPKHELSGANTFVLGLIPEVVQYVDEDAIDAGILRARSMLQRAAALSTTVVGDRLAVRVTNKSGHKLPTGYPEGRRMWLNVQFYDRNDRLIGESGAYDSDTAELALDAHIKIYEAIHTISPELAPLVGLPAGTRFHLVLNNMFAKDNRIPPLGFRNADYAWFGGAPVGAAYADGQNWDITDYDVPVGAVRADVALYYQTASKDYIEFLRDNAGDPGTTIHTLWQANGKSAPELMVSDSTAVPTKITGDVNCDALVNFDDIDAFVTALIGAEAYAASYPTCWYFQADADHDGSVNFDDIDPFIILLIGG